MFKENICNNIYFVPFIFICFIQSIKINLLLCIIILSIKCKNMYSSISWYKNLEKISEYTTVHDKIVSLDTSNDTLHELIDNA